MFTAHMSRKLLGFFLKQDYKALHTGLLRIFHDFNRKVFLRFTERSAAEITAFLEFFFSLWLQDTFVPGPFLRRYLSCITLLENLCFLSDFKTTDGVMRRLLLQPDVPIEKLLMMLNMRVAMNADFIDTVFQKYPDIASYWLYSVFRRHTFGNETVLKNLQMLQEKILTYKLTPHENMYAVYFNATYVNPGNHLLVRKKINQTLREYGSIPVIHNNSHHNHIPKIAVISAHWQPDHAVQKCIGSFIESLADCCELYLLHIGPETNLSPPPYVTKAVCLPPSRNGRFCYGPIINNDYNMVIFPDIGLNMQSLLLANTRIAPVQIAMYGHPVSTASDEIDYFIVGKLSETADVGNSYTEKTIAIEGNGMSAAPPETRRPSLPEKMSRLDSGVINIFVTSSPPKINPEVKRYWKKIVRDSGRPVRLHFLPGDCDMQELSVMRLELERFFGPERVCVHPQLRYQAYMDIILECDVAIGSSHYGDYNRVIDSLWMGTPVVVVGGTCGYQNTGPGTLKALGLTRYIASDMDDYVAKTIELVTSSTKRRRAQQEIIDLDIQGFMKKNKCIINSFKDNIVKLVDVLCTRAAAAS